MALAGNNVSHANNKIRRRFIPNLQQATMLSETLGKSVTFRVCTNAIRTVEKRGGIDAFLLSAKDTDLSTAARAIEAAQTPA